MFIRLISKTNHPYSDMRLSREQFDADYELLEKYIEWRRKNQIVQKPNSFYNVAFVGHVNFYFIGIIFIGSFKNLQNLENLEKQWQ